MPALPNAAEQVLEQLLVASRDYSTTARVGWLEQLEAELMHTSTVAE